MQTLLEMFSHDNHFELEMKYVFFYCDDKTLELFYKNIKTNKTVACYSLNNDYLFIKENKEKIEGNTFQEKLFDALKKMHKSNVELCILNNVIYKGIYPILTVIEEKDEVEGIYPKIPIIAKVKDNLIQNKIKNIANKYNSDVTFIYNKEKTELIDIVLKYLYDYL